MLIFLLECLIGQILFIFLRINLLYLLKFCKIIKTMKILNISKFFIKKKYFPNN